MENSPTSSDNRRLGAILLLALTLRVGALAVSIISHGGVSGLSRDDTHTYVAVAEQLVRNGQVAGISGEPEIRRSPGYPVLLMPGTWLGHWELVTAALQIVLSIATVWLVYRTTLLLFDSLRAAQLAALLFAVEPLSIIYSSVLLTETLFTFLFCFALFEMIVYFKRDTLRDLAIAALAFAAAAYVRPAGYFLAPMLTGLLCLRCFAKSYPWLRALRHAIVFGIISISAVGLWQARNYALTGYHRFSAISDCVFYYIHGAAIAARLDGKTDTQQRAEWGYYDIERLYAIAPELREAGQAAKYNYMHDQGVKKIKENPLLFAKIYFRGIVSTLGSPGTVPYLNLVNQMPDDFRAEFDETLARRGMLAGLVELSINYPLIFLTTVVALVIQMGYYILFAAAALNYRSLLNMSIAIVIAANIYLALVAGGVMGTHRYRIPIMPMICIAAGLALATLWRRKTRVDNTTDQQPIPAGPLRAAA